MTCTHVVVLFAVICAAWAGFFDDKNDNLLQTCDTHYYQSPTCFSPATSKLKSACGSIDKEVKQHRESGTLFFQIGDFGLDGACERQVADLVKVFEKHFGEADFLQTLGDNNYWNGHCDTLHKNIGAYYGKYIPEPKGCVTEEQRRNTQWQNTTKNSQPRFWPCIGNHDYLPVLAGHDWEGTPATKDDFPYLRYFDYLGKLENSKHNGGYYHVKYPHIELYALNSNLNSTKDQAEMVSWLEESLGKSTAPFQMIFGHHPSHSTALADPTTPWLRLPFDSWTKHKPVYFCGHEHVYERLNVDEHVHVINGLGGHNWRYYITECEPAAGSQKRYNEMHGAVVGWATEEKLEWCFYNVEGDVVDHMVVPKREA